MGAGMNPDLPARLRRAMRGETVSKTGVTGVTGVTDNACYASKSPELRQLRLLRVENSKLGNDDFRGVTDGVASPPNAPNERAANIANNAPAAYRDAFARLLSQRPCGARESDWLRAIDSGAHFLEDWGDLAREFRWTGAELFASPGDGEHGGLVWFFAGERVRAFGPEHAISESERIFDRIAIKGGG